MSTVAELNWRSLTSAVNEMRTPNTFVKDYVFGTDIPKPTENIEVSVIQHGRRIAPFVRKNGEAVMVPGHSADFYNVQPPNIRIKRPFTPSDLLFSRKPDTTIFQVGTQSIEQAVWAHIGRDLLAMEHDVQNSEELLACQMLVNATIAYTVEGGDAFTITVPRPAANNVVANVWWNDPNPFLPTPEDDFTAAKQLVANAVGLGATDCILGTTAATQFRNISKIQNLLDRRSVEAGMLTFTKQINEQGALYLGSFCGINVWEYNRTVLDVAGAPIVLIPVNMAIFFNRTPQAEHVCYYGAIPDIATLRGGKFMGKRFSKSWEVEDPSALWALLASCPLPISRRPGAVVRMQVVGP